MWHPASDYDAGELARACREAEILFDPRGDLDPEAIYLQIVRPGVVSLPPVVSPEVVGRFGLLTVTMPPPSVIAAAKLTRASARDLEDVAWWVRERSLDLDEVSDAIGAMPRAIDRETALDNMVLVELVTLRDRL